MRLFVAIDPPPSLEQALLPLLARLVETKADVRWVEPRNRHITLKFLGETDEKLVPDIATRLTSAAAQVPVFPLHLEGVAKFPPKGQPRVIVVPILSPDQRITRLHRLVDSAIAGLGLPLDTRALVPHLTLGRVSSNHGLNRLLRLLPKHEFDPLGSFDVAAVTLYHSTLTPRGSVYTVLHQAPLAGADAAPPPPPGEPLLN